MNIILFGPPGIGKSTLIGHLKTLGRRAVDLEDFKSTRFRYQIPNMLDGVFIGAADLDPKRKYPNAQKVLLYMPQEQYVSRRKGRDKVRPSKAEQAEHSMLQWEPTSKMWDAVVDVSGRPSVVAATLSNMYHEE